MSVVLKADDGTEADISNGEWMALTSMARGFTELPEPWNGDNGCGRKWSPAELCAMAARAEQMGRAAGYLRELAKAGGAAMS